jgi:mannose-1-phosphate guanylyltransferase
VRAVVLVGGEGTRLRPLTLTRPKPMLPVAHRSMLEAKLAHLAEHGVTDAVLSLGYKPDAFIQAFPNHEASGVRLQYAVEPSPLDTAGAIRFAASEAGYLDSDELIIAVNGDVLTDIDLTAQLAFHRERGASATIALTQVEEPSAFGVVPIDATGAVIAFVEKPKREEAPTDWINAGIYVLERSVFDLIPEGERVSIERATFPILVGQGSLYAVQDPAYWLDAGTPATLLQANLDAVEQGASAVHESATIVGAVVDRSVIGEGSTVESGAIVRGSVVMCGARIANGAIVEDSIVGDRAILEPGAELRAHTIVGDDVVVPAGRYDGGRLGMIVTE